jgi:hypothetical protein
MLRMDGRDPRHLTKLLWKLAWMAAVAPEARFQRDAAMTE